MTKLPTPLEAAARADEGHAVASGLGLDEVAALLRSMAQCSNKEVREALARAIDFICTSGFITPDQAFKLRAEFNEKCVPSILATLPSQAQADDK